MTKRELAKMIDTTLLRATATQEEITDLCHEAEKWGMAAVSINPSWVSYCAKLLKDSSVAVNSTVGFPLGATTASVKIREAKEAIEHGADELDMVINIGAMKSGFPAFVGQEIGALVKAVGDIPVKVILETCYLTDEEKIAVCQMAMDHGAAYVKTSTGYGTAGATVDDVKLMRNVVGESLGVKAAGGIRTYFDAMAMVEAGASRIGTSAAVDILSEIEGE